MNSLKTEDFYPFLKDYIKINGTPGEYKKVIGKSWDLSTAGRPIHTSWVQTAPIYVADGSRTTRPNFPERRRGMFCFVCGSNEGTLSNCEVRSCQTKFHQECLLAYSGGGYTYTKFMIRNQKIYCPLHHCTSCFADHNRVRCYIGPMVYCSQCELAWHNDYDCIPGGCVPDSKNEIICPRHVQFHDALTLHTAHCADCQKKLDGGKIETINCTKCFRNVHFKCLKDFFCLLDVEIYNTPKFHSTAICHWCHNFDFVRYGQYAMGRLSNNKWYPCRVVRNEQHPKQTSLLGAPGYMVVQWLPYRGHIYYNVLPHNRVLIMSFNDYFFMSNSNKSEIREEWGAAQKFMRDLAKRPPKPEQIDINYSNGEHFRMIKSNRFTKLQLKHPTNRKVLFEPAGHCYCCKDKNGRCGPTSNCVNRQLYLECPKECAKMPKGCLNRNISDGKDPVPLEIKYFPEKGHGAIALSDIVEGEFIGEYVGEVIDQKEKKKRIDRIEGLKSIEAQYYIMDLDNYRSIDAQYYGNQMRFLNHSCDPNCTVEVIRSDTDIHLCIVAKKMINKGLY